MAAQKKGLYTTVGTGISTHTIRAMDALMAENNRLKAELKQATEGLVPPSYIPQDVAGECLDLLREVGMGKKDSSLCGMIDELCEAYRMLYTDVELYKKEYKGIMQRFELVWQAADGDDVESRDRAVHRVMKLRAVLETISIRLDRFLDIHPELASLNEDITAFLSKKTEEKEEDVTLG